MSTTSVLPAGPSTLPKTFASPKGRPFVGQLFDAWEDPLALFTRTTKDHGDLVRLRFAWLDYYLLNDAAAAHRVLVENAKGYHKSPNYDGLKLMLGQGLLTAEGETWRRQRKLTQPAFHRESLNGFATEMVDATQAMLERWRSEPQARLDLHEEMMRLTFRIVGKTLLGADLEADAKEFGAALTVALTWVNEYVESIVRLPPWVPTPANRRFVKAQRAIEGVVKRVVDERKSSGEAKRDLLGMLMSVADEQTGEQMNDRQLMDELLTLTLAGHETTANALTFTFYLLSRHPDVAARARAEAAEVLGGRAPELSDLASMPVTRAVIEEAMRLYPPAWVVERISLEDDEVMGRTIPKGSIVAVSPYALHRNPRYFADPERFDPQRFLTPDASRPKLAYMPFGAGPRTCIGNAFAMMEMQLIVPMLLQAFDVAVTPGFRLELDPSVTLRPKRGVPVTLTARPS
ncbi:MAG: cytochrome P450 [Polyangiaceae bacterium]|jgi:cytochrome P450|nr:cytochrome P450 [Polyangiaceae bacterium]MBK8941885.1 cytochrome P450 [Polyangiaceae bacterium]